MLNKILGKLWHVLLVMVDYLHDEREVNKLTRFLTNIVYLTIGYAFTLKTAAIVVVAVELLNFIVWYYKIRTGELDETREKFYTEFGGGFS